MIHSSESSSVDESRRSFLKGMGTAAATGGLAASGLATLGSETASAKPPAPPTRPAGRTVDRVAARPMDLPAPIDRNTPKTHDLTLEVQELVAEIEPGVTFNFMTYNG